MSINLRLSLALASLLGGSALATTPTEPPAASAALAIPRLAAGETAILPAGSVIVLRLDQEIHTKRAQPTDGFDLHVAEALVHEGRTLVPEGALAHGEVIHAQKPGMMGKPAELLLSVRWVEVDGQRIATRHFRPVDGKSREGAAMALSFVPVAGLFAPFIRGGHIVLPPGSLAAAQVVADVEMHGPAVTP